MPRKYIIKPYVDNGIYHIFNRGVNRNLIFRSEQDCTVFVRYIDECLLPKNDSIEKIQKSELPDGLKHERLAKLACLSNFAEEIQLLVYCLMPNHVHLVPKQKSSRSITSFMRSLMVRYAAYFNKKYTRIGGLCQCDYQARHIRESSSLLTVTTYVHQNPMKIKRDIANYPWSSMQYYIHGNPPKWLNMKATLDVYNRSPFARYYRNYLDFVRNEIEMK